MNIPSYISGAMFAKAHRALRAAVVKKLQKNELSPTEWTFIGVVASSSDGIRLVELAKRLGVKAPLITLIAHHMLERGLITRIAHPIDKRAKLLVITAKGKQFVQRVEKEVNEELTKLLHGLTEKELDAYKKVLDTIIANSKA